MTRQEPIWYYVTFGARWQAKGRPLDNNIKKKRQRVLGSVAEFLICHFFHNPNHIFNLSLHWHKQAVLNWPTKLQKKVQLPKDSLSAPEQALGWWNSAIVYPAASSKSGLGPTLWASFPLGNSPTFVLWSNCPLYVSVFQFLIHKPCLQSLPWRKMFETAMIPQMRENLASIWPEMWLSSVLLSFTAFQVVILWYVVPPFSLQKRKQSDISYPSTLQTDSSSPLWWLLFPL